MSRPPVSGFGERPSKYMKLPLVVDSPFEIAVASLERVSEAEGVVLRLDSCGQVYTMQFNEQHQRAS